MKNVIDFILWALTHAKKETVPIGAVFPSKAEKIGTEPWEYLYGTSGKKVTQSLLDERWKNHYSTKTQWTRDAYLKATAGWVERKAVACDCQGLLDHYLGSDTNANGNYIKYCTDKGKITDISRPWVIGEAVFNGSDTKKTHVGWVCGFLHDGSPLVVHERGLAYGCVITTMQQFKWTYRGLMKNIFEYKGGEVMKKVITLTTPLMRGEDIKQLQVALNGLGYDCGKADGIAGQNTIKAIEAFTAAHSELSASPAELQASVIRDGVTYAGTLIRK